MYLSKKKRVGQKVNYNGEGLTGQAVKIAEFTKPKQDKGGPWRRIKT